VSFPKLWDLIVAVVGCLFFIVGLCLYILKKLVSVVPFPKLWDLIVAAVGCLFFIVGLCFYILKKLVSVVPKGKK